MLNIVATPDIAALLDLKISEFETKIMGNQLKINYG